DAGHDAGQGQVPAHVEGLYQAVALTVLGDEAQTGADALTDRLTRDRAAFEGDLTGHDRLTAGDPFEQFGAPGAHQPVDAHDLPAAHLQVDPVDHGPLGVLSVGDHQVTHLQDGLAELVSRGRLAQVEVLSDHVPH